MCLRTAVAISSRHCKLAAPGCKQRLVLTAAMIYNAYKLMLTCLLGAIMSLLSAEQDLAAAAKQTFQYF